MKHQIKCRNLAKLLMVPPKETAKKRLRSSNLELNAVLLVLGTAEDPFLGGDRWGAMHYDASFRSFAGDLFISAFGTHCSVLFQKAEKAHSAGEVRSNEKHFLALTHFHKRYSGPQGVLYIRR